MRPPTPEDTRRAVRARRATSFGALADTYDRVRPGYPAEAVEWLLPEDATHVLDLGAGTGALTRTLVALGLEVIAVEPDPKMRAVAAERVPSADLRAGRAEEIPVGDGEVDAVVGGQMWHWVDLEPAAKEVARVLRPGGVLGLLWNLRDERVAWMAELGAIFGGEDHHIGPGRVILPERAPFTDLSSAEFTFSQELATDDLVGFVASRSNVQVLEEDERGSLLERVAVFSRTHPDLAGRSTIEVPYVTSCWRATRT